MPTPVKLTADMKRVLNEQRLGFVASVCEDGTPNLSPKGTTTVWDDEHIVFADICSPGTIANIRHHPVVEINVVDPVSRKGYRFKGTATIHQQGPIFEQGLAWYRQRGTRSPIRSIVLVQVERAIPLISPAYDQGKTPFLFLRSWSPRWEVKREKTYDCSGQDPLQFQVQLAIWGNNQGQRW